MNFGFERLRLPTNFWSTLSRRSSDGWRQQKPTLNGGFSIVGQNITGQPANGSSLTFGMDDDCMNLNLGTGRGCHAPAGDLGAAERQGGSAGLGPELPTPCPALLEGKESREAMSWKTSGQLLPSRAVFHPGGHCSSQFDNRLNAGPTGSLLGLRQTKYAASSLRLVTPKCR